LWASVNGQFVKIPRENAGEKPRPAAKLLRLGCAFDGILPAMGRIDADS
jgi:hypothetical protein